MAEIVEELGAEVGGVATEGHGATSERATNEEGRPDDGPTLGVGAIFCECED